MQWHARGTGNGCRIQIGFGTFVERRGNSLGMHDLWSHGGEAQHEQTQQCSCKARSGKHIINKGAEDRGRADALRS